MSPGGRRFAAHHVNKAIGIPPCVRAESLSAQQPSPHVPLLVGRLADDRVRHQHANPETPAADQSAIHARAGCARLARRPAAGWTPARDQRGRHGFRIIQLLLRDADAARLAAPTVAQGWSSPQISSSRPGAVTRMWSIRRCINCCTSATVPSHCRRRIRRGSTTAASIRRAKPSAARARAAGFRPKLSPTHPGEVAATTSQTWQILMRGTAAPNCRARSCPSSGKMTKHKYPSTKR